MPDKKPTNTALIEESLVKTKETKGAIRYDNAEQGLNIYIPKRYLAAGAPNKVTLTISASE